MQSYVDIRSFWLFHYQSALQNEYLTETALVKVYNNLVSHSFLHMPAVLDVPAVFDSVDYITLLQHFHLQQFYGIIYLKMVWPTLTVCKQSASCCMHHAFLQGFILGPLLFVCVLLKF